MICYHGSVSAKETEAGLPQIQSELATLSSGFRLLADLTDLTSMEPGCAPFIEQVMDLCNAKGTSLVVRVIPDRRRDIGFAIMSIFHYASGVRIVNCETIEQADRVLNG